MPHQLTHHSRARWSGPVIAIAGLALLPGLLTACSSPGGADAADTPAPGADAAKIGACLRDKGYDVDDSQFSGDEVELAPPAGADPAAYITDLKACSPEDGPAADTPERQAAQAENAKRDVAFSACIRGEGFDDYPDGQQERLHYEPSDPAAFAEVEQTCAKQAYGASRGLQETGR